MSVMLEEPREEVSEERWAEQEEYIKKSFPGKTSDRKYFGFMIFTEHKEGDWVSFCCNAPLSYSTGGCQSCCICSECGQFLGCLNNNPEAWQALDEHAALVKLGIRS